MKTKNPFILFAWAMLLCCVGLCISCSDSKDLEDLQAIMEPLDSPANARNPFDFVGVEHNRGLEHLGQFADSIIELVVVQKDQTAANEFVTEKLMTFYGGSYNLDSLGIQLDANMMDHIVGQPQEDAIDSLPISDIGKQYLLEMNSSVESHSFESTKDANEILALVKALEDEILVDSALTYDDRSVMLAGTSLYRHSLFFWTNLLYDDNAPWSRILSELSDSNKALKKINWKKIKCLANYDLQGLWANKETGAWAFFMGAAASALAAILKLCN